MEHGYQGRYIEGYNLAKEYNLKFLFGTEAYWVKDRYEKDRSNCHIYIGAKNENGRQAINDILSEANITGFYGQARIDVPLIMSLPKDDVIVSSACLAYWKYDDIDLITEDFANHFGKNFFLEVQYHNTDVQREINKRILTLRDKLKIPIIMGCDSHYIVPEQSQIRTDFLLSKGLSYPEEEGWFLDYPDGDTAYQRFANQCVLSDREIRDAIDNTNIFLDVEEYDCPIFNTKIKMPSMYPNESQEYRDSEYKKIIWNGWGEYKKQVPEEKHNHYETEIQKEIDIVVETKMSDYFINNYHIIEKGKENGGQLTKSGRGSAVSFITNMLLGFTEVDRISAPIKMYPERFMSATRILQSGSLPDIDFNCANIEPFAKAQKEVLGEDHSYPMISYGTMQKSAAWKLYAKAQGIPFEIANAVSSQIKKYEMALKRVDEDSKDDVSIFDYISKEYQEIYEKSKDYLGLVTSWSIAPCSYLLYEGSIRKEIGLIKIKDHLCCLMDGHWAEDNHFLKNDLLKVSVVDLIYKIYHNLGMEPHSVSELLAMCPPDDPAWTMYEKSCTLGLNQCEQVGTSARVAIYKPSNVSELCAFIAAIRPGFKSMYKTFESRKPFKYGIKAFDELIQTEEMPNTFVLYQEQEMAALNYAGINMSDCYTAIKNIAKKRVDKVLAYKEKFNEGFKSVIMNKDHKTEQEASMLVQKLWQIIEDSSQYSFNASHSYCVSIDSLYGAWLKAHHPLEFYEVALTIQAEKGDKDKMNAFKEEAENYFNIKFPLYRFGQDNRSIKANVVNNEITNSLTAIKGYGSKVGDILYKCGQVKHDNFISVLRWLDENSIKSSKTISLAKIDYFQCFGNTPELLRIIEMWDFLKQGKAKSIKKENLSEEMRDIIKGFATDKNAKGLELKSYAITDMDGLLNYFESYILQLGLEDFGYGIKATNQNEILGYVDLTTDKEEDRRKLLVLDIFPIPDQFKGGIWKYKVKTKSIGSGKVAMLDVTPSLYDKIEINKNDILFATKLTKDKKGYWQMYDYKMIRGENNV